MKKLGRTLVTAAAWLLLWQIIYMAVGKDILIPSPLSVAVRIAELAHTLSFWESIAVSLFRVILGFAIGLLTGSAMAVATSGSSFMKTFLSPFLEAVKAVPVASFIILAVIWLDIGNVPVLAAALVVLPNVWANMESGILSVDEKLLEMARAFRFPKSRIFTRVTLPSLKPYFSAAVKNGMGMAWKAGIAAEVICPYRNSIGTALHDSKIYLETTDVFAWTAVVVILSVIFEKLILGTMLKGEIKNDKG